MGTLITQPMEPLSISCFLVIRTPKPINPMNPINDAKPYIDSGNTANSLDKVHSITSKYLVIVYWTLQDFHIWILGSLGTETLNPTP